MLPRCRLHHLPELPQQHLTSPSHKELWKRSSSSHINLIPVLVSRAQWHIECSLPGCAHTAAAPSNQGVGKGLAIGIFLSPPQSNTGSQFEPSCFWHTSTGPHSFSLAHCAWTGTQGATPLWSPSANPVQDSPKGILGSKVSWSRQVTSHLQHWINRISHKLVQLPLNSSVLPTWQQAVLIYSCADSDPSPPFEAAQGMPGLSAAHSFSDVSWLPSL